MYERRRINIINVYVIGSVGSILQEEQIENIAFKYEQIGCEVEYVKKVSDNLTFDLIKDCFNKIEWADLIIVVPKSLDPLSFGDGTMYEIEYARSLNKQVAVCLLG